MTKSNISILIVDDSASMRIIVKNMLREIGYSQFAEAANGKSALQKLQALSYDLVISDWNMPGMTGLDLLKTIRNSDHLRNIPFIMLTTEGFKENILSAVKCRVSQYIVKPFSAETLMQKIDLSFKLRP